MTELYSLCYRIIQKINFYHRCHDVNGPPYLYGIGLYREITIDVVTIDGKWVYDYPPEEYEKIRNKLELFDIFLSYLLYCSDE